MNNIDFSKVVLIPSDQLVAFAFLCALSVLAFDRLLDIIVPKLKKMYHSRKRKNDSGI